MSFILDALKKSETDRQRQGSAEFAGVPTSAARREGPPAWLWIVGVLLVVNLAVLIGIFMRPGATPVAIAEPPVQPQPEPVIEDDFEEQVAAARQNAPPRDEPATSPALLATPEPVVRSEPDTTSAPPPTTNVAALPTVHEVRANGTLNLPELHVDIHVYSEAAGDRFAFINMAKYNEGSQLSEGPVVEEITPDGVVLSMNGTTFLLPRD